MNKDKMMRYDLFLRSRQMDTSRFLSKVIGIYLLIISVAIMTSLSQFTYYVSELVLDNPLMFVTGFFTLILGIIMVVSHNLWQWNWRIIITLLAWLTLIKGASIIFYPHVIDVLTTLFLQNVTFAYSAVGFDFVLGILLCYCGFRSNQ